MASFTFNGLNSETDYDLRIHDVLYNVLPQTVDRDVKVPYGRGRYDYGTYLDANTIGFVCSLQGISYADVFTQVEAIAAWLNPELGVFELSYSGKPNRHCYAKISGNTSVKQILLHGKFTVIFKIPEGVWYGDEVNWTSNEATLEDEEVGSIFTTPSDMAEGAMKADLSGMTVTNLVTNGDFSDGTTGWVLVGISSYSITNNVIKGYFNGSTALPGLNIALSLITAHKYFIRFTYNSNDATNYKVVRGNTSPYTIFYESRSNPGTLSKVIVANSNSATLNIFSNGYTNHTPLSTEYIEFGGLIVIDLTAHGLDRITDTATLDAMFPHYIEGTVHAGATRFTSVGKNLFDKSTVTIGRYINSAGGSSAGSATDGHSDYTVLLPNTVYVRSHTGTIAFYDMNKVFISISTNLSFTTPTNTMYARYNIAVEYLDVYQLELGSTATTYEPYHDTHTTGTLPELHRLPNDVRDTYDLNTGVKVQRVQRYVLQSADIIAYVTTGVNIDRVSIKKNLDYVFYNLGTANSIKNTLLEGYNTGTFVFADLDNVANVGYITANANNLNYVLVVAKGTYPDLAAAQAALAGTVIYYELATPVKSYVDPELENQDDEAVNFLLGGPSYTVNIDIDGCPCPMTQYGTMEVIENDGGLSTEGVIEITCDFNTSFLEIKLDDSDEFIRIEDTFLANDVIEINLNTGSVTKNGTSILDKVTLASTLFDGTFKIPRGTSLLSLHGASELTLVFEEKWL